MSNLPTTVLFDKVGDIDKNQVADHCRGLINKYFTNTLESYFYIKKVDGVWYCEIQEGGPGKAFLPELLKSFSGKDVPEAVYIPSATRYVKVVNEEDGMQILALTDSESPDGLIIKATSRMSPYESDSRGIALFGLTFFTLSLITMIALFFTFKSVESFHYKPQADKFLTFHTQYLRMESLPQDRFINKVEYKDGKWTTDIQRRKVIEEEGSIFIEQASDLFKELTDKGEFK